LGGYGAFFGNGIRIGILSSSWQNSEISVAKRTKYIKCPATFMGVINSSKKIFTIVYVYQCPGQLSFVKCYLLQSFAAQGQDPKPPAKRFEPKSGIVSKVGGSLA
jgi:hypothetical protein